MKSKQTNNQKSLPLTSILLVVMIVVSLYLFIQNQRAKSLLTNPTQVAQSEIKKLVNQVGKLIELPKDETPSMATVTDKKKLANQAFFAKAQNGDKILLYQINHKAILYRPSINKIIEVSTVSNITITPLVSQTVEQKVTLAIYNGSKTSDRVNITEKQIIEKFPETQVVKKTSTNNSYSTTSVIDLKGNKGELAKNIADYILGEVTSLPENEATPEADILIILGQL